MPTIYEIYIPAAGNPEIALREAASKNDTRTAYLIGNNLTDTQKLNLHAAAETIAARMQMSRGSWGDQHVLVERYSRQHRVPVEFKHNGTTNIFGGDYSPRKAEPVRPVMTSRPAPIMPQRRMAR